MPCNLGKTITKAAVTDSARLLTTQDLATLLAAYVYDRFGLTVTPMTYHLEAQVKRVNTPEGVIHLEIAVQGGVARAYVGNLPSRPSAGLRALADQLMSELTALLEQGAQAKLVTQVAEALAATLGEAPSVENVPVEYEGTIQNATILTVVM